MPSRRLETRIDCLATSLLVEQPARPLLWAISVRARPERVAFVESLGITAGGMSVKAGFRDGGSDAETFTDVGPESLPIPYLADNGPCFLNGFGHRLVVASP